MVLSRLRLIPVGLVSGTAAVELCEAGNALALAGGPLAFTHARVSGPGAPSEAAGGALLPAAALRCWAAASASEDEDGPAALIAKVSAPRPNFAALPVSGAGARPRIMGVCNVTPDSFSDGGAHALPENAIVFARRMIAAGADIIDVGGESTRPGAAPVDPARELARVMPVVTGLVAEGVPVSIDTRRAEVMRAAIDAGVSLVNDVSALADDPDAMRVVAASDAAVILVHMRGQPADMQDGPRYDDVLGEVHDALAARIDACRTAGIAPDRIAVDPGFGFGKTLDHNLALLAGLAQFHGLGCSVAVGLSRKSFIGAMTGEDDPAARMPGSIAAALLAVSRGAQIVRVHDVAETRQALGIWRAAL